MSTRKSPRNKRRSMVEERESTPEGRLAMEAARTTIRLVSLLNEAFEQSGITREELAKRLGTDVDRVNAILEGGDELRIATVARTAYALGYKIDLVPVPYKKSVLFDRIVSGQAAPISEEERENVEGFRSDYEKKYGKNAPR